MFLSLHHHTQCLDEAVHAEPETVSCDNGCFAADLQMDMLQDLNWMIHKKIHFMDFFQPACVGCNELRDRPESLFPQVSWIQGYEAFDRQIGELAGRWDWGMSGVDPGRQKGGEAVVF